MLVCLAFFESLYQGFFFGECVFERVGEEFGEDGLCPFAHGLGVFDAHLWTACVVLLF